MRDLRPRRVVPRSMREHARSLRRKPTDAQARLWAALRDRRLSATKWRRQFPIGDYIVDFVCLQHRLIVECDGPHDAARDAWLISQGFAILRVGDHDALRARDGVVATILAHCGSPS